MYLSKKVYFIHILILLVILFFNLSCTRQIQNPLTLEQVVQGVQNEQINVPIHSLDLKSKYGNLETVHYFYGGDGQSEEWLETYFVHQNENNQTTRVARLTTYYLLAPVKSGELIYNTTFSLNLNWSYKNEVIPCHILFEGYEKDQISSSPYRSCFVWSEKHYNYKLHTIWPDEEMEPFLNDLVEVARPSWTEAPPENKPTASIEDILKKQGD